LYNKIRKFRAYAIILTLLVCMLVLVLVQPMNPEPTKPAKENPKFIISSWDFPDEYGQGIEGFEIFENSTGSWVQIGGEYTSDESLIFEWNVSVAIKLNCWTWFNSTLTGAATGAEGKNYQQHSVDVTQTNGTSVFSQQNFTYFYVDTGIDPPLWFYGYEIVLNFLPNYGETYTATVIYEVYW
jgi:hypothetical protein